MYSGVVKVNVKGDVNFFSDFFIARKTEWNAFCVQLNWTFQ